MGYYFNFEDLQSEVADLHKELKGTEKNEELSRAIDVATNRVRDAVEAAPEVETPVPSGTSGIHSFNYDLAAGQLQAGDPQSKANWAREIIQANDKIGGAPEELLKKAKEILGN